MSRTVERHGPEINYKVFVINGLFLNMDTQVVRKYPLSILI